jgi:hypothetical protein
MTTVREFVEMLRAYPLDANVVVDDVGNCCLLPPRLRLLTHSGDETQTSVLISWPSDEGDFSAGDEINLGLQELIMFDEDAGGFDEDGGGRG